MALIIMLIQQVIDMQFPIKAETITIINQSMTFSTFEEKLRDYVRKYPSIIDHTTCLSFTDQPEEALKEVANKKILMANLIVQENNKKPKEEEKKKREKNT